MTEGAKIPTIASGALRKLLDALERLGVDAEAVRIASGVDRKTVDDPEGRLPVRSLHAAWTAAEERLRKPDAALLVAEHYVPADYGLVGFVAMNCATLGDSPRRARSFRCALDRRPELRPRPRTTRSPTATRRRFRTGLASDTPTRPASRR